MRISRIIAVAALISCAIACNKNTPDTLGTPKNLRIMPKEMSRTTVAIQWDDVDGAKLYRYEFCRHDGMTQPGWKGTINAIVNAKGFSELTPGTSYRFKVRAENGNKVSEWSNELTVTTHMPLSPGEDEPEDKPGSRDEQIKANYPLFAIPEAEETLHEKLAFPGAQGGGMYTTGGRGGDVYHVTNLSDSGAGSLREGLKKGNRTIVFDVAGIIELQSTLKVEKDNITIAGQTAPGDGICLKNYTLRIAASNVIVRFVRCRMGDEKKAEDDAMNSFYNTAGDPAWHDIIVDHCSMSWSTDECGSFYGSKNFTLQWCILSESLTYSVHTKGAHGYGGIWGGQTASFHHNLLAHHSNRVPRLCGSRYSNQADKEKVEVINNVYYNWTGEGAYAGQGGSYNLVGNFYKPGPATIAKKTFRFFTPYPDDGTNNQAKGVCGKFYLSGNFMDDTTPGLTEAQKNLFKEGIANNYHTSFFVPKSGITECTQADFKSDGKFKITDKVNEQDAISAYEDVLLYAGTSHKRDAVDSRIINEVKEGKATYKGSVEKDDKGNPITHLGGLIDTQSDCGGWPSYAANAEELAKIADTDRDGMPDWFEDQFCLDKNNPADATGLDLDYKYKRYTNLEMYLHYLVREVVK